MDSLRKMQPVKRIALVAHDNKKADLLDWVTYNKTVLASHKLMATGTTGTLREKILHVPVKKLMSGPVSISSRFISARRVFSRFCL